MTVSTIAAAAAGATSSVSRTDDGSSLGGEAFLQLLVAQLKYQDPMNPAQGTEFLAQTAQFAMVEKLTALTQQSSDALAAQRAVQAGQLVGKQVSFTDADGTTSTGLVTGARLLATGPVLLVGGQEIALSSVTEITTTGTTSTTP
jgi:flagellar basal-body rod modification protein FlgD